MADGCVSIADVRLKCNGVFYLCQGASAYIQTCMEIDVPCILGKQHNTTPARRQTYLIVALIVALTVAPNRRF
jgi:hypothetical protein